MCRGPKDTGSTEVSRVWKFFTTRSRWSLEGQPRKTENSRPWNNKGQSFQTSEKIVPRIGKPNFGSGGLPPAPRKMLRITGCLSAIAFGDGWPPAVDFRASSRHSPRMVALLTTHSSSQLPREKQFPIHEQVSGPCLNFLHLATL